MRLLLDTHALLWWVTDDPQLSSRVRDAILDEANDIFVSAASAWEISTKARLGRLNSMSGISDRFSELVAADGFGHLAISYLHCLRAGAYRALHRDPFDRVLAAQTEIESLTLITRDPTFSLFDSRTLW